MADSKNEGSISNTTGETDKINENADNDNMEESPELSIVEVEIGTVKKKHRHSRKGHSHHHHSRSRKRKRKKIIKRVLISVGASLLSIIIAAVGIFFVLSYQGKRELTISDYNITAPDDLAFVKQNGSYVEYNGSLYRLKKDLVNIMVIGVDRRDETEENAEIGENGQADMIMVAAIDPNAKKITMLNIPRDVMTDVKTYSKEGGYSGLQNMQICLSYAYGSNKESSALNTLDAVKRLFYNLPINSFYSLDLVGISEVNDAVGGVDVKSPETILQFEKGETYHLEGRAAQTFVQARSHQTADANLLRNERQKVYLTAFFKKAIKSVKKNPATAVSLFNVAAPYSCTDFNTQRVTYLANMMAGGDYKLSIKSIPVTVEKEGSYAYNYVKEKEFYELFLNTYYEKED